MNPDSGPHNTGGLRDCVYTELNPEPVLEKWSHGLIAVPIVEFQFSASYVSYNSFRDTVYTCIYSIACVDVQAFKDTATSLYPCI